MTTVINALTHGTQWPVVVSFRAAGLAMAVSATVGMVFGFFPALRAAAWIPLTRCGTSEL